MKQIIRLIFIALLVISCQPKAAEASSSVSEMGALSTKKDKDSESLLKTNKDEVIKKKIIKDGRLGIKVKELKKAKANVDTLVQSFGGYYDNESFSNTDYETAYTLKIRIPSDKLDAFVAKIEMGESQVAYKEIDARDVTEEFIDLESRLDNKQRYLTRYQELLKSAKNIKEILDIQEKIRVLQEEIESVTGRLKYLNDLVNYSTIELNISQEKDFKYIQSQRENYFEKLKHSLSNGWYGFIDFMFFLLSNWAILILISVLIYFWIKYRRKRKSKQEKN